MAASDKSGKMSKSETDTREALTLQAVNDLLKPLDERITKVLSTQVEMKTTIGKVATLKNKNEKLKQIMCKIEEIMKN